MFFFSNEPREWWRFLWFSPLELYKSTLQVLDMAVSSPQTTMIFFFCGQINNSTNFFVFLPYYFQVNFKYSWDKKEKKKKLYVSTYIDEKYQFFNHFIECKVLFYQIVDIVLNLAYIYLKEKKNIIDAFAGKIIIII